jgi:cell wall-associated NlpC family hydrolase
MARLLLYAGCANTLSLAMNSRRLFGIAFIAVAFFALAGCGGAPLERRSPASPQTQDFVASRISPAQADDITIYALGLVGTPYRYGGNTPESGFDCSGLIGHVFQTRGGVTPPRTVSKLQNWGQPVSGEKLRTGDLVFFGQGGVDTVTHGGIYVGGGRFVHAPSTGGEVRLDSLNSKYWASRQAIFRRP